MTEVITDSESISPLRFIISDKKKGHYKVLSHLSCAFLFYLINMISPTISSTIGPLPPPKASTPSSKIHYSPLSSSHDHMRKRPCP